MEFAEYQARATETAIYPGAGTGSTLALTYIGLGLGEVGEIQGKIKKIMRDDHGQLSDEKRMKLLDETGDALWYLTVLVEELGDSMDAVAQRNLEKLASRQERGVLGGSGDDR